MASLEGLRNVSIGRYVPGTSALHLLDSRVKVGGFLLVVALAAIVNGLAGLAALVIWMLILVTLSGIGLRSTWNSIYAALPFIVVLLLLQLAFTPIRPSDRILLAWGRLRLSWPAVRLVIVALLRFFVLMLAVSLLTGITSSGALIRGVEGLLRPFTHLGLPAHELALVGSVALRFLPLLGEQVESIAMAQASRGLADTRSRWKLAATARRVAQLIVPLFVDVYRRSEELALAMQARCYNGGKGRTHLIQERLTPRDWLALAILLVSSALVAALP
ncbi:MAG: energy-coupling factor transporter transmembrane component T [Anaerolineales bacterium]